MKFLSNFFIKNWKIKITSILVAIVFWGYNEYFKFITNTISVPVTYKNRPKNLTWLKEPPRYIKLTFKGAEEDLKFPTSSLRVMADLSFASKGEAKIPMSFNRALLPERVELASMRKYLTIEFDEVGSKSVKVQLRIKGVPTKGYKRGRVAISPDEVTILGPISKLKKIRRIYTKELNINGISRPVTRYVKVKLDSGLELDGKNRFEVKLFIYSEKNNNNEKKIKNIKILTKELNSSLNAKLSQKNVTVVLRGEPELLSKVQPLDISAFVSLVDTSFNPRTGNILPIDYELDAPVKVRLNRFSDQVEIISFIPETIRVDFSIKLEVMKKLREGQNR